MTAVLAVLVALTEGVATQAPPAVGAPAPQYDLAGAWVPIIHEDGNNRAQGGEYEILAGLPLNEAARVRWEAFSEDQWSLVELQCRRFLSTWSMRTVHVPFRVTTEFAPDGQRIVAFNLNFQSAGA